MTATQTLDAFYLEARCRLLDLAAILDRIDRGDDASTAVQDPRSQRLQEGVLQLMTTGPGRAERVQKLFSLEYDATWSKPQPRY